MCQVLMNRRDQRNVAHPFVDFPVLLSSRQDNAYLTCRPPENPLLQRKERPPLQEYIRHLVHTVLNKARVARVALPGKMTTCRCALLCFHFLSLFSDLSLAPDRAVICCPRSHAGAHGSNHLFPP